MRIGISIPVRDLLNDHDGIAQFAREAEELGFTHLRVPDRVAAVGVDHAHEPLTLLAWVAALTETIELVPSVIVLPTRQTVVVAKQAAEIDRLSGGRLRFGVGVGARAEDYAAFGQDFHTRGKRCDEQIAILRRLWTEEAVHFEGRWDRLDGERINPLPVQQPIPIWIGGAREPGAAVLRRIGGLADGWFALMAPEAYGPVREGGLCGGGGGRARRRGNRLGECGPDRGEDGGGVAGGGRGVARDGRHARVPAHAWRRARHARAPGGAARRAGGARPALGTRPTAGALPPRGAARPRTR